MVRGLPLVRLGEVCSVGCHGVYDKKLTFNTSGIRCFFTYPSSRRGDHE